MIPVKNMTHILFVHTIHTCRTAIANSYDSGFLNDIVKNLWPNICVAGSNIIKETVEPILASTLPGPLGNLRFVKIDFGQVPIGFSNVDVHRTKTDGIKLDMDMTWEGVCDFELDGSMVPKVVRSECNEIHVFSWS
jgi:hypothetical protein